jgi:class 3 adenylate cyclase/tetratricopeptide (TPR) repeat protein
VQTCPDCGRERSAGFARCGYCGHGFAGGEPMADVSRRVTVLTSDLQGSTALGEKLDPESLREVLDLYFDAMRLVLEAHGGTIEKVIGDAILAVFGLSDTRPDHALRAVRAAAEGQVALRALNARLDTRWGIQLSNRTGVASGVLVVRAAGPRGHILTGDVVAISGRLEQSAPPLEALLDEPTYAGAGAMASVAAEPFLARPRSAEPMAAFRLVSVDPTEAPAAPSSAEATGGRTCPNCGTANLDDFRLCGGCGAPLLVSRAAPTRKTVTIIFAALHTRDGAGEPLAPDAQRAVIARAFEASREALARHGGTIEKFIGDAVMAVFGLPFRHEDDALRAVRAALEMRAALNLLSVALHAESGTTLEPAIGINTGEVITGEASLGQRLVTGDAVNVAARLEQAASPGQVLLGGLTASLVRGAVRLEQVASLTLKGKSGPVPAFRLMRVLSAAEAASRPTATLVGREAEMAQLTEVLETAVDAQTCQLVTLVGDAGVGKTRLAQEFLEIARARATVIGGRCLPYGDGITFWPIVELVRGAAGILETDTPANAIRKLMDVVGDQSVVDRVAAAVGLNDAPFQVGELFWGIRRMLETLATDKPLLVLFDDIHWAEPTFLDLLDHLTANSRGGSILLLCLARRELLEKRPTFGQAPGERTITLAPLADADAARVAANLLGEVGLADAVRDRVVAAAEGNPLFVEQLVSMLRESGRLRLEDGRWAVVGDLSQLDVPPTIHALLAARLDALPEAERAVIDPASVIGLVFATSALQAIVEDDVRPFVPERLELLGARQLIRPVDPAVGAEGDHRFGHQMIRDAAYSGLLKRTRARLHERLVAWADEANRATDRGTEFEEILGYHLEQAHRYLAALGPLDEHGVAIGIDASARLASASHRAFVRGDMPATANLAQRAAALLPEDHPARPKLLFRLGIALKEGGQREPAVAAFGAAAGAGAGRGDEALEITAHLERMWTLWRADPSSVEGDVHGRIQTSIAELERLGDHAGLVRAWTAMAEVWAVDARWGAAAEALGRVVEHARQAGDRVAEIRAGPNLAFCAMLGPTPVVEAVRLCEEVLARSGGDRTSEALILRDLARLHAMQGDFALARIEYRRARTMLDELGWRFQAALTSLVSGPIEMLAGDPIAAEAELRRDKATLEAMGDHNYIATVAAYLAEALYRQGRYEDAEGMASLAADVAASDDVATQVVLRSTKGRLLSRVGRHQEAESICREAVDLSRTEEDPADQGMALSALADVLRARGKEDQATEVFAAAVAIYEAKGDVVSAAVARRSLAEGKGVAEFSATSD